MLEREGIDNQNDGKIADNFEYIVKDASQVKKIDGDD